MHMHMQSPGDQVILTSWLDQAHELDHVKFATSDSVNDYHLAKHNTINITAALSRRDCTLYMYILQPGKNGFRIVLDQPS